MLPLTKSWAKAYENTHPGIVVSVAGGGSAVGVKCMINGEIDICVTSRPLKPGEAQQLAQRYNRIGMGYLMAKDALSIYLNPGNPVNNLTIQQLRDIYTGNITNWKDISGLDEPISVIIRSPDSGTYLYFKEHILEGVAYASNAHIMPTTSAIIEKVVQNRGAIGYGGIAYGPNVVHAKIDGITPTEENVRNDTYPIIRYLYLYTIDIPQGKIKGFIDWIMKEGQKIVKEVGYIPLWELP
jgi:phosphate transport system substrate-binding protein